MQFLMHEGRQCTGPNELLDAGLGNVLKGASPGLGRGVHAFYCLVSGLQYVGKRVAWIQERWQCSVVVAFMGRMLGQATHLKVHCPALAYTNIRLFVFPFIAFIRSAFWGKEMGGVLVFALCRMVCVLR